MSGNIKLIIPPEEIHLIVNRLAREIRNDYASKNPVLIGVLKGALVFMSDLMRVLKFPFEIDFIQASSYMGKAEPSADVVITKDAKADLSGRDVLIVECIVDRGVTASALTEHIKRRGANSVKFCTLLMRAKLAVRAQEIDYVGARVGDGYVVGYGLDYREHMRGLPGLYVLEKAGHKSSPD